MCVDIGIHVRCFPPIINTIATITTTTQPLPLPYNHYHYHPTIAITIQPLQIPFNYHPCIKPLPELSNHYH